MNNLFNDTLSLLQSEPKPEVNSTYVAITGIIVFGFPIMTMALFCVLRVQLDKRKRYRGLFIEDRLDPGGNQCPIIGHLEDEQFGTSSSTSEDKHTTHTNRLFMFLLNFLRMEQSTTTDDKKNCSLDSPA